MTQGNNTDIESTTDNVGIIHDGETAYRLTFKAVKVLVLRQVEAAEQFTRRGYVELPILLVRRLLDGK